MFYNIHGMIDQWYRNWEQAVGVARKAGGRASSGVRRGIGGKNASKSGTKRERIT